MARTCGRRLDSNPKPIAGRDRRLGARGVGVALPDPRAPATTSLHRCYRIALPYTLTRCQSSRSLVPCLAAAYRRECAVETRLTQSRSDGDNDAEHPATTSSSDVAYSHDGQTATVGSEDGHSACGLRY